jgi:serine/threonine protein phosphatase 1
MSRIVLTDPHGCLKTLKALIAKLPKGIPLTFAGDLVDRGPNSRGVIELVKSGAYDCVVGNHEVMMLDELSFGTDERGDYHKVTGYHDGIWLMNGGDKCLDSYDDENGNIDLATLKAHCEWLKTLPYYLEYPELKDAQGRHLLVTHTTAAEVWGEVSPDSPQFKNSVTWERIGFPAKIDGIYNIYGHTPQQHKATIKDHFACIDTGGYFKRQPYGKLTALQFPEMIVYEQENIEDEKK